MNYYTKIFNSVDYYSFGRKIKIGEVYKDLANSAIITPYNPMCNKKNGYYNIVRLVLLCLFMVFNGEIFSHNIGILNFHSEHGILLRFIKKEKAIYYSKICKQMAFVYINKDGLAELIFTFNPQAEK